MMTGSAGVPLPLIAAVSAGCADPPTAASPPASVVPVSYPGPGAGNSGALSISGSTDADKTKLQWVAAYQPADYGLNRTAAATCVRDAVGIMDGGNSSSRGARQESLFRALYDRPAAVALLGFAGGTLTAPRVHMMAESSSRGLRFDTRLHALVP